MDQKGYITNFIKTMFPRAEVQFYDKRSICTVVIAINNQEVDFDLTRGNFNDLENAFDGKIEKDQSLSLKNVLKYRIYVLLGKKGLIPEVDIANEVLVEEREWLDNFNIKLVLPIWLYEVFYSGLKKLSSFLEKIIKESTMSLSEIEEEKSKIEKLIKYFEQNHTFDEESASNESLGFFKAGAVCEIIDLQKQKRAQKIPRIKIKIDNKIYNIVEELRKNPFPQIKMTECVYDYFRNKDLAQSSEKKVNTEKEGLIFLACGQLTDEEKAVGLKVKQILGDEYGLNVFFAESVNDLESLNSHIFRNLSNCTGFIALLHKRNNSENNTSVWINQEVAIIAYLRSIGSDIPSLVMYQDGAKTQQGLIKYTIANPPVFISESDAILQIREWVKTQKFEYKDKLPEIDISSMKERHGFGSTSGGGRAGYVDINYPLSFRVRNKSDVNVCLEDINVYNDILGEGRISKKHSRTTKLPLNIKPHYTEEVNISIGFKNEVIYEKAKGDFCLTIYLEFSDRLIEFESIGFFKT